MDTAVPPIKEEVAEVVQEVAEHFVEVPRVPGPDRTSQRTVEPNSDALRLQEQIVEVVEENST